MIQHLLNFPTYFGRLCRKLLVHCLGRKSDPEDQSSEADNVLGEQDIDDTIKHHREALELHHPSHPMHSSTLKSLADALHIRFQQTNDVKDIDEAIEIYTSLLAPHGSCVALNNLGTALQSRFESEGDIQDVKQAVHMFKEALALHSPPHENHGISLNQLCDAVKTWIDEVEPEESMDVDEALEFSQEMLAIGDISHPDYGASLNHIAGALCVRFQLQGNFEDISKAIQLFRKALVVHRPGHPLHGTSLNDLATTLQTAFEQRGDAQHITEAIELYRNALQSFSPGHRSRTIILNNLSNALRIRFVHCEDPIDLDEAIHLCREALEFCATPHPDRSLSLNNLGNVIGIRDGEGGPDVGHAVRRPGQPASEEDGEVEVFEDLEALPQHEDWYRENEADGEAVE
ncbi:hypothetical protein C8J57DRAFT_1247834 [Mycena rebaudengoi]|nr:hypothetical protein C8J57DRAFT_1247834 [Mycena rebaudengoi]